MTIPCKNCLVLAVCRNKNYRQLMDGCSILYKTLYKGSPNAAASRRIDFVRILIEVDRLMSTDHRYGLVSRRRKKIW